MRIALVGAQADRERIRAHANGHRAGGRAGRAAADFDQDELRLPGPDQLEIDLGQQLGAPGYLRRANNSVSTSRSRGTNVFPARSSSALRKARSNSALCATSGASPMNATRSSTISAKNGLSLRTSLDRPWMATASGGTSRSGLT